MANSESSNNEGSGYATERIKLLGAVVAAVLGLVTASFAAPRSSELAGTSLLF